MKNVGIKLSQKQVKSSNVAHNKLFLKKFEVGARWFDDITESNRSRQG